MQNKLYTRHFFSPFDDQFAARPRAVIAEPGNHRFREIPEKERAPVKVQTPR